MTYPAKALMNIMLVSPSNENPVITKKGCTRKYDSAIAPRLYPMRNPSRNGMIITIASAEKSRLPTILAISTFAPVISNICLKIIIPKIAATSFHVNDFLRIDKYSFALILTSK